MSDRVPLPIVAIVGRPNVGKSRLFNRYAGERRALVRDQPGVTRDRIASEISIAGRRILLVDTAGLDPEIDGDLAGQIQFQARSAVEQADAILFVVDSQAGLLPEDEAIARTLRRTRSPLALAINKIDVPEHEGRANEFYSLGFASTHLISAEHGRSAFDPLEELVAALPHAPGDDPDSSLSSPSLPGVPSANGEIPDFSEEPLDGRFGDEDEDEVVAAGEGDSEAPPPDDLRIAVVGRPNVGKSSLVNRLLGEERVVVSDIPGTTRDSVDMRLEVDGDRYVLVDTAGLRRPGRRERGVERVSALMTVRALERAEVALMLIDASEGFTDQDAHVASLLRDRGCAAVVLANKWDLVSPEEGAKILEGVEHGLRFMSDVTILTISAKTGARVGRVFGALRTAAESARRRIPTSELNRWLQESVRRHEPKLARRAHQVRRRMKFFYAVQTGISPPSFALFCTQPDAIQTAYKRYLENRLRDRFGFEGTPVRIHLRGRNRR